MNEVYVVSEPVKCQQCPSGQLQLQKESCWGGDWIMKCDSCSHSFKVVLGKSKR